MKILLQVASIVLLSLPSYAEGIRVKGVEAETILRWGEIQLSYVQERDNPLHNRTYYLVEFEGAYHTCWVDHAEIACDPF